MEKLSKRLVSWASLLDEKTVEQARTSSTMPFIYPHLALMPDAHLGLGATVGSVIPTLGAIIPAAVGVDIGCGMIAVRRSSRRSDLPADRRAVREQIERAIPLSAGQYNRKVVATAEPRIAELEALAEAKGFDPATYAGNWRDAARVARLRQPLHRGLGRRDRPGVAVPALGQPGRGQQDRAAPHRGREAAGRAVVDRPARPRPRLPRRGHAGVHAVHRRAPVGAALRPAQPGGDDGPRHPAGRASGSARRSQELERINCHHNFTESEEHFGKRVWVSRKGAIQADVGRPGLIPGSMGTASYVVEGLGHPMSLNSSPHGAGRSFSRSAARRTFTHDAAAGGDGGHRVPRHRRLHRRDPAGLQADRPGHGATPPTSSRCGTRCGSSST